MWAAIAVGYFALTLVGIIFFDPLSRAFAAWDGTVLGWFTALRSDLVVDVALAINVLASRWTISVLRWSIFGVLIAHAPLAPRPRVPRRHVRARRLAVVFLLCGGSPAPDRST